CNGFRLRVSTSGSKSSWPSISDWISEWYLVSMARKCCFTSSAYTRANAGCFAMPMIMVETPPFVKLPNCVPGPDIVPRAQERADPLPDADPGGEFLWSAGSAALQPRWAGHSLPRHPLAAACVFSRTLRGWGWRSPEFAEAPAHS